jgi:PAS domain S-box-containing protein
MNLHVDRTVAQLQSGRPLARRRFLGASRFVGQVNARGEDIALTSRSSLPAENFRRDPVPLSGHQRLLPTDVDEDRLYAAVVRSVSDAIISKTIDGTITGWNRAAERLFGYTSDEAIGQSIDIISPSDRRDEVARILETVGRGEHIEHYETVRLSRDGRLLDVSLSVSPVRAPSRDIIGAAEIVHDITDQKFAERKFELAVEACPSGILMIDSSGAIVLVNAELERQFGYDRSELVGKCIDMLLPERLNEIHAKHRALRHRRCERWARAATSRDDARTARSSRSRSA